MSWFSRATRRIGRVVKKHGVSTLGVAALAIPGAGAVVSRLVNAVGRVGGGIKAQAEGVSESTTAIAGGLASSAASGYVDAARATPVAGSDSTLAQVQGRKLMVFGGLAAAAILLPRLLSNSNRRGR